jgi:hypothetical protein
MSPNPGPLRDKYEIKQGMIDWMGENADQPFRFSPINVADEVTQRVYPVGYVLYGSPEDLVLFRINFGF